MSRFTYRSSGYLRKSNHCKDSSKLAFPVIAVLALIFFHVGTAAAQPSGDSLNQPPAGTQLAFVRGAQIYLINADGTGLIQLTEAEPGVANRDPAWSRDGQRLAFARVSYVGGFWDIYIMDADGLNVVRLTHDENSTEPTWGPGDHTIAFSSLSDGTSIYLGVVDVDAAGSQASTILFDSPGWDAQPAWSPDGQTIMFSSDYYISDYDDYDRTHLYAMNADGSNARVILTEPPWNYSILSYLHSAWSPDGQNIAVVSCPDAWDTCYPDSVIAVVNADESELREMVETGGSGLKEIAQAGGYAKPTWSPDGQWIAFSSSPCRECQSSIRFVSVDGGVEGLLVDDGHSPAWRPDTDTLNAPDDPDGPIKEPDEPAPDDPKDPPPPKLPECVSKCDKKGKLTGTDFPDEQ